MPTPSLRASATFTNGTPTTTVSFTIPASTVAGDYLYAFIGSTATPSSTPPAGWTLIDQGSVVGNLNTADRALFRRVAQAGDASSTVNFTTTSGVGSGILAVYKDVNGQDQFAANGTVGTSPTSWASASVTTTAANDLVATFFITEDQAGGVQTITLPSTARVTAASYDALGLSDFVQVSAGATPTQTASGLAGPWGAYTVALLAAPNTIPYVPAVML